MRHLQRLLEAPRRIIPQGIGSHGSAGEIAASRSKSGERNILITQLGLIVRKQRQIDGIDIIDALLDKILNDEIEHAAG